MARRGLNIYKRKDGRWEGRYKCGYNNDGKAKYRSVYGKSYSAVKTLLEQKRADVVKGVYPCKCTVSELLSLWLSDIRFKIKESTYANYNMKLQKHILPYFAGMKYEMLTAQSLNRFIQDKLNSGLSAKYISDIVVLLKSAAKFGARNYGYANRIEYAALPKSAERIEKPLLTAAEQQKLQQYLMYDNTPSNVGILLSMATGIRIGELCALKWADIDFEKRTLAVSRTVQRIQNASNKGTRLITSTPKSRSSVRIIPLPDFIIPVLRSVYSVDNSFLLSGTQRLIEPRTIQYRFKSILKRLELPQVNFHSLRHAFATNCVVLGFDIKTLSEILGHSSVEVTLNRYVHSSMERKRDCMKLFSDSVTAA